MYAEWSAANLPRMYELGESLQMVPEGGSTYEYWPPLTYSLLSEGGHIDDLVELMQGRYVNGTGVHTSRLFVSEPNIVSLVVREGGDVTVRSLCVGGPANAWFTLGALLVIQGVVDLWMLFWRKSFVHVSLFLGCLCGMVYAFEASSREYFVESWHSVWVAFFYRYDLMGLFRLCTGYTFALRFVWFISGHPRLSFLSKTLSRSLTDLSQFAFILIVVYCIIGAIGQICFGERIDAFSTFSSTLWAQYNFLLGQWDFDQLLATNNLATLFIYLLVFQVVFLLIIVNIFLAILISAFDETTKAARGGTEKSVAIDGILLLLEAWKGWREEWPSRDVAIRLLAQDVVTHKGWDSMRLFYHDWFINKKSKCVLTEINDKLDKITAEINNLS